MLDLDSQRRADRILAKAFQDDRKSRDVALKEHRIRVDVKVFATDLGEPTRSIDRWGVRGKMFHELEEMLSQYVDLLRSKSISESSIPVVVYTDDNSVRIDHTRMEPCRPYAYMMRGRYMLVFKNTEDELLTLRMPKRYKLETDEPRIYA